LADWQAFSATAAQHGIFQGVCGLFWHQGGLCYTPAKDSGKIEIANIDITRMKDSAMAKFRRHKIGVVFQEFNLLSEKNVLENILMPLKLDGKEASGIARARELIQYLGLEGKEKRMPIELSGGEQQRVAIARALIANPAIILADEPTGNLDSKSAKEICTLLNELNESKKCTILMVTHDAIVASAAKRIHFLKEGKIIESFEPAGDSALISKKYIEVFG
jgi:putative ABC transport system ATP-binding protein